MNYCIYCYNNNYYNKILSIRNNIICQFCILGYSKYIYKQYKNNDNIRKIAINLIKNKPRMLHILKSLKIILII